MKKSKDCKIVLILIFAFIILFIIFYIFSYKKLNNNNVSELLKQLITFTALLITLIYGLIIPKVLSEQEQREVKFLEYKERCKSVAALRQFIQAVSMIGFDYFRDEIKKDVSYINHIPSARIYELWFPDTVPSSGEAEIMKKLNADLNSNALIGFLITLHAMRDFNLVGSFKGNTGTIGFDDTKSYIFNELDIRQMLLVLHPMCMPVKFQNDVYKLIALAWAHDKNMDFNNYVIQEIIYKCLPFIKYLPSKILPKDSSIVNYIFPVIDDYRFEIGSMYDLLIDIVDNYSPKKYIHLFVYSCIALLFGVIIPLFMIALEFSIHFKYFVAVSCNSVCLSMLTLFLFETYKVFNEDKLHDLRKYLEKKPIVDMYEELERKDISEA